MKLKNTTTYPDYMLRRMVSWCCRELRLPVRFIKKANFRNRNMTRFSGHAYHSRRGGSIVCSIGPERMFPWTDQGNSVGLIRAGIVRTLADRMECLINITAHELRHLLAEIEVERTRRRSSVGSSEARTERDAQRVLDLFRANRDALLADWQRPPARQRQTVTRQERNEAQARKKLVEWERKLALAKTKVRTYRTKVRYYDRVAATRQ